MAPWGCRIPGCLLTEPLVLFLFSHVFLAPFLNNGAQLTSCMQLRRQTEGFSYTPSARRNLVVRPSAFTINLSGYHFIRCSSSSRLPLLPQAEAANIDTASFSTRTRNFPRTSSAPAAPLAAVSAAAPPLAAALDGLEGELACATDRPSSSASAAAAATDLPAGTPSAATAGAGAGGDGVALVQLLHAPSHAVFASLVQEALQCLLWGSDSDVEVSYESLTLEQLHQQLNRHQQPGEARDEEELSRALEAGAVQVRVFFERTVSNDSRDNNSNSSNNKSRKREEKGRLLLQSLHQVPLAADLVIPAASRRPEGDAALRMAAVALQQQPVKQQLQQQLLQLQRCRAALPLRRGALWASLLCAEATAKLKEKAGEDVLPLAVEAVESAHLVPLSWYTLGHSLRLHGRLWESNCCYKVAAALDTKGSASADAMAVSGAATAAVPRKLIEAMERALVRAKLDPTEMRRALPTLLHREVGAPWGFAVDANPPELGGLFVAYVVEGSKADKAGLMQGDQIVITNDSIVLGLPFNQCLDALRTQHTLQSNLSQQDRRLQPLQLEVYRGPLPLLYGAPALAALRRLDAVKEMLGDSGGRQQHQTQQQQKPPIHVPAGCIRAVLQGGTTAHQQPFEN